MDNAPAGPRFPLFRSLGLACSGAGPGEDLWIGQAMTDRPTNTTGLPDDVWHAIAAPERLSVLDAMHGVDAPGDPDFDRVTRLAASLMQAPVALVTLLDTERQWFKASVGVDLDATPVGMSFCAHAVAAGDEVMVVTDATADPRFARNPLVTGDHAVRFYVGAPILVSGERVGTLCVLDRVVRPSPEPGQIEQLKILADLVSGLFVLKENTRTGALAREALVREEKRRAVALAAASLASWVWEVDTGRVECDETLPPLFGLPPSSHVAAGHILNAIDQRDLSATKMRFRKLISGHDDYSGECRVKGFDPPRWLAARGRVFERDAAGRPKLIFGVSYDITERKLAEERQKLLLRELNHRVKNTLATVQALASQTVRHARDPAQFLEAFSARLQAMGQAHGMLSENEWRGVALGELVRQELMSVDPGGSRVRVTGSDIVLTADQALGLGLVLHELASNAQKFGALSVPSGSVNLDWSVAGAEPERKLLLTWTESGGPAVEPPVRQGFGSILIRRSLAKVIASEVSHEFRPEGVYAAISLPLEASSI